MAIVLSSDEKVYEKGVWVEYEPGVSFKIRMLTPKKYRQLQNSVTTKQYKRGQLVDKVNETKLNELAGSWMIEDWKGIVTPEGTQVDCTDQNKQMILNHFSNISAFVSEMSMKLLESKGEEKKQLKKKSQTP